VSLHPKVKTQNSRYVLATADINWDHQNPYSTNYKDIYWSRDNPLQEKMHVFPNQHQLEKRGLNASHFTIAETGFGFGNNFLLTADLWRAQKHKGILHYIAFENSPVKIEDLTRHYQSLNLESSSWLLRNYPLPLQTSYTLWFGDTVRLSLIFDDAISALGNMTSPVDAWYLDGFSPSSNSDLWNKKLYGKMFDLSKPGTTLSTYTVAGAVRQGLGHAGFNVEKIKGFGNKAEMLTGKKPGHWVAEKSVRSKVAVLGSGVAGSSCVDALRRRDVDVLQISHLNVNAASDIPALMTYPQLGLRKEPRCQFSIAANNYSHHQSPGFNPAPLLWRSNKSAAVERMRAIADQFPDDYLSSPDESSVLFHQAGWVEHPQDTDLLTATVTRIESVDDQWHVLDIHGKTITIVDQLIIAMGIHSRNLLPVPLTPIRGQSLTVKSDLSVPDVMTGDISIVPLGNGKWTIGGTYQRNDEELDSRTSDTDRLLQSLYSIHPGCSTEVVASHVGIRAATRDRLPLVGRVPDWQALQSHIEQDQHKVFDQYQKGLYVSTGFGSHGATNARLCGEYVANLVCGEPGVLNRVWEGMLSVERFRLRDARRGRF
jgi:tRNA 5-methylaminomethyl-2-thiouridine biosynthesis bifunctional protein